MSFLTSISALFCYSARIEGSQSGAAHDRAAAHAPRAGAAVEEPSPNRRDGVSVRSAEEAREAEARIREAQQKHQELESEREALRRKAQETRAAEQVRCPCCPSVEGRALAISPAQALCS